MPVTPESAERNSAKTIEEIEEDIPRMLFAKVSEKGVQYSPNYKGPRNAVICLGVKSDLSLITVAFATSGGRLGHAQLVPIATPTKDYEAIRANLISEHEKTKTEHVLEMYYPREKDRAFNLSVDPDELLKDRVLVELCHKLSADKYIFADSKEDSN